MTVSFDFQGEAAPVRDAATVVVMRDTQGDPEIFFVRRSSEARFMGGAYVFPGGRLDPGDLDPELSSDLSPEEARERLGDSHPDPLRARGLFVAAARECLEESGILLSKTPVTEETLRALRGALAPRDAPSISRVLRPYKITLSLAALRPLARWITPKVEARRFDAIFFVARCPESTPMASHDGHETVASVWLSAREALERAARREIVLAPPTWRVLDVLSHARTVDQAMELCPNTPLDPIEPAVCSIDGEITVILPDDPMHPEVGRAPRMASIALAPMPTRFQYDHGVWVPTR